MSSRKRNTNESFVDYRASLKTEHNALKSRLAGVMSFASITYTKDKKGIVTSHSKTLVNQS